MSRQQKDDRGFVMDNVFEFGAAQVITNPTVSTQTTAFGAQTTTIRVACTGDHVHIAVNSNPTATTSSSILPAGIVEIIAVQPGWKLAVIKGGGAGSPTISVTELI